MGVSYRGGLIFESNFLCVKGVAYDRKTVCLGQVLADYIEEAMKRPLSSAAASVDLDIMLLVLNDQPLAIELNASTEKWVCWLSSTRRQGAPP